MPSCPKCDHDLESLETYDNMYVNHNCPNCNIVLYLDYYEDVVENEEDGIIDTYDVFLWEIVET